MNTFPQLVLFDLDGTLVDTVADLGSAVNHALRQHHLPEHPIEAYKLMVGHGVKNLVQRAMPESLRDNTALWDHLLDQFMAHYRAHLTHLTRPYPGIPELLAQLASRGVQLAVVSNKFQEGTQAVVHHFFPQIPFCALCGVREGFPLKPHPAVVQTILAQTGITEDHAVLVGDSATDMQTARNAHLTAIAVGWGFQPHLARPLAHHFADTVSQLESLLLP